MIRSEQNGLETKKETKTCRSTSDKRQAEELQFLMVAVTKKEAAAIAEYAGCCHETVSDIIRKSIIRETTLADGFDLEDPEYEYQLKFPQSMTASEEKKFLENTFNKIRALLGWRSVSL